MTDDPPTTETENPRVLQRTRRAPPGAAPGTLVVDPTAFKPKIGHSPERDVARLRAIREAVGPDVSLRANANQGYSVKEAIRLCRLAEQHDVALDLLEQPVAAWDVQGMAHVRRSVDPEPTPGDHDEGPSPP